MRKQSCRSAPWRVLVSALLLIVVVAILSSCADSPSLACTAVGPDLPASDDDVASLIRCEFLRSWSSYKKYAWGHDELKPLSLAPYDWYGPSLEFTPVDALDTMLVMGMKTEADEARALIDQKLSFDQDIFAQGFEVNIRLVGGLLSSYQMTGDQHLLALAQDLANRLLPAFNSPTRMPYHTVNLHTGAVQGSITNPGEVATYLIEFGTLSKLTGNPVYYNTAKQAVISLYNRRSSIGLFGSALDVNTGAWTDTVSTIGGGTDSFYEYLLKSWLLFGDTQMLAMWNGSIAAINTYLADTSTGSLWYGQADMNTGQRTTTLFGALDAFFPAVLARSGDLVRGRELEDSAYQMWSVAGVEPTFFDYSQQAIVDPHYNLYPEIIESAYYLYFYTQDPHFRQIGRGILHGLLLKCRTPAAYAQLSDVRTGQQVDRMQSYFFAEVLKYSYLLFAGRGTLDLNSVVFNTEGHPMRRTW